MLERHIFRSDIYIFVAHLHEVLHNAKKSMMSPFQFLIWAAPDPTTQRLSMDYGHKVELKLNIFQPCIYENLRFNGKILALFVRE
jgi:hypothetical protein